jgi:transcriptional regulator with XRE-family HTH domain
MGKIQDTLKLQSPADLGQAIRGARKRQGLTLVNCAAANGVSVRFLSELERGKPGASIGAALKIARSVGLRLFVEEAS